MQSIKSLACVGYLTAALGACAATNATRTTSEGTTMSETPTRSEETTMNETPTRSEETTMNETTDPRKPAEDAEVADAGRVPARIIEPGSDDSLALGPVAIAHKLRAADGAGFSMVEYSVAGAFEAPPKAHWHTREHCVIYILEGELLFQLAQGERRLTRGAVLHLPPGAPFAWSNPNDTPARYLALWSPGGFESFFAEVIDGLKARAGSGPPSPEHMGQVIPPLWEKYGIETGR